MVSIAVDINADVDDVADVDDEVDDDEDEGSSAAYECMHCGRRCGNAGSLTRHQVTCILILIPLLITAVLLLCRLLHHTG